jgi:glyceraldehyde 3-phosphate dehydrogenase
MNVAINGFGRIGRAFLRLASYDSSLHIVAINDLGTRENLQYLLQYDTVYGRAPQQALAVFAGAQLLQQKDPAQLPWKDLQIDVVIECTGFFTEFDKAQAHITAGAKRVVISAPGKGEGATVLMGLNDSHTLEEYEVYESLLFSPTYSRTDEVRERFNRKW